MPKRWKKQEAARARTDRRDSDLTRYSSDEIVVRRYCDEDIENHGSEYLCTCPGCGRQHDIREVLFFNMLEQLRLTHERRAYMEELAERDQDSSIDSPQLRAYIEEISDGSEAVIEVKRKTKARTNTSVKKGNTNASSVQVDHKILALFFGGLALLYFLFPR
ncbi:hypothetical protein OE88DRAFT_803853 [Heliocybe sulcata]|uniref:Uncharacterized protein n=1 Tax=Heliocybe sulcata TaxID=5364 RepID=A0A5C3N104_9AGAM|nr:hypothetical protein OE88DRAFT_803853 [Heliocybe sulcata]